ncbi:MAG: LytTR family transcriptional regulator, partial [Bacteroidetes bacterium]|nr:LytTR family transcriptional regulator [Bacteroidota bacterium]
MFLAMLSDLKKNYKLIISFLALTAIALFVIQPFIIANIHLDKKITAIICFSSAFLITMIFQSILFPNLFTPKLNYRDWSLSKQVTFNIWLLFMTGFFSFLFVSTFYVDRGLSFLFEIMLNIFAIYALPQFFFTLFLIREKNISEIGNTKSNNLPVNATTEINLGNGKNLCINDDLVFIKAEDNYVALHYLKAGKVVRRLERISIAKLEQQIKDMNFIRCHRSYIVNMNFVDKVERDKMGTKVLLKGFEDLIPVSRRNNNL